MQLVHAAFSEARQLHPFRCSVGKGLYSQTRRLKHLVRIAGLPIIASRCMAYQHNVFRYDSSCWDRPHSLLHSLRFCNHRGHSFRKLLTAALGLLAAGQHRISKSKTWLFMPSGLVASVAAGAAFRGGFVRWRCNRLPCSLLSGAILRCIAQEMCACEVFEHIRVAVFRFVYLALLCRGVFVRF